MRGLIERLTSGYEIESALRELSRHSVLVVGDMILDRWIIGSVNRISPEAPVPVLLGKRRTSSLGGAGNVAVNLRKLGLKVGMLTVVGTDSYARKVQHLLEKLGIEPYIITECGRPTTVKTRIVADNNHQICRIDWERTDSIMPETESALIDELNHVIEMYDFVVVSDYAKGMLTPNMLHMVKTACYQTAKPLYAGPKPKNITSFNGFDIISLNQSEFMESLKSFGLNADGILEKDRYEHVKLGSVLRTKLELGELIITRGPRGMSLIGDGEAYLIPALTRQVYDVTGAGDTVLAVYSSFRYVTGDPLFSAVIASLAAAITVTKFGTGGLEPKELVENAVFLRKKDRARLAKVEIISGTIQEPR